MVEFLEKVGTEFVNYISGDKSSPADVPRIFRYGSFAEVREKAFAKWYVNGKDYFHAVSEAISNAEHEIFIEDWWLSPELFYNVIEIFPKLEFPNFIPKEHNAGRYLRRPPYKNEEWRLDRLLKRKAKQGVKIYVVLYRELEQALTLNSKHSKKVLIEEMDGNILVQRHPDHGIDGTFFWAHHE
ncbi:24540_t:CDS:2, partial [Racocetra persica]